MANVFKSVEEFFAAAEGEDSELQLTGMIQQLEDQTVQFSPAGCDDWITMDPKLIAEITLLGKRACTNEGKEAHTHPYVLLKMRPRGDEFDAYWKVIAKLGSGVAVRARSSRALSTSASAIGRDGIRLDADYDCQYGFGACGGYNRDTGEDCAEGTRPCYEDGYIWCRDFTECTSSIAPGNATRPGDVKTSANLRSSAVPVGGPAGYCTDVWFDGTCYWARNRCGKKVNVHLGPWSALLNPGQTFRFVGFGNCFQSYVGDTFAEFA
jgi:hypothetical protein